ncbi:DNA ligase (ATP) [Rhizina undulata]
MSSHSDTELPDAPAPAPAVGEIDSATLDAFDGNKVFTEEELDAQFPHRPKNTKPTIPFHELYATLFDPLIENSKKQRTVPGRRGTRASKPHEIRRNIIDRFISKWRRDVGDDIYPAFKLILCDVDRDRSVYNLKEKAIGKLLINVMKISKDSQDGYALANWREPGVSKTTVSDFAARCHEVIKKRPMRTTPGNLTVTDVNNMLDKLSMANKQEDQMAIMKKFYNNMNADELMWLIRIIMRQMKIGASERTFFEAWHPDASALFNISSSLRRVCWELFDPELRLDSVDKGVSLMSCFQPQLAQFQKKSFEDVVQAMHVVKGEDEVFWIEEKLDGERMQMHYENGKFRWWSRKGKEYTHLYGEDWNGESSKGGCMARHLKDAFDERVESIILDGEMVTWDLKLDCIVEFGTLKTAALEGIRNPYGNEHRPFFKVFDILYLNGECLVNYTLRDRRRALERSIKKVHRRLEIHEYTEAKEASEIEAKLRQVIAEASEGLVIKNPRSVYRLNERNDDWVKVKPEYMTEFGESLDCLVIGGYWGRGSRGGILSSYLCGLRVDGNYLKPGDNPMKFWSFCKVGGGITAHEYAKIAHITENKWHQWDSNMPPKEYIELAGGDNQYEKPDVWIKPEDSIVLEIKASSVSNTDQFRILKTLRFPRFKRLRDDKDWTSALSVNGFMNLKEEAGKEQEKEQAVKKLDVENRRRGAKRVKRKLVINGADDEVKPLVEIDAAKKGVFEGWSFYIVSEAVKEKKSKAEIEQLVKAHGAKIYQNETAESNIKVIGDRNNFKISAIKKKGTHDIIKPRWIFDCIKQHDADIESGGSGGCILPLEPCHILHATKKTEKLVLDSVDKWGDSYTREPTDEELANILKSMSGEFNMTFDVDLFNSLELGELPGSVFRNCVVYLDFGDMAERNNLDPAGDRFSVSLHVAESYIIFAGGRTVRDIADLEITHIVIDNTDKVRLKGIRDFLQWRRKLPRVVTTAWVKQSFEAKTLLDEERFAPVLGEE